MTRAQAPGKVVVSGAYAVLSGAPAIVTAVSRYVVADSALAAELVTPEVKAALAPHETAPWFDASALREAGRKLGLGSSAAIVVASLYALERDATPSASQAELRQRVFARALAAHRAAQSGGSGVDVAASVFGGTLHYQLSASGPTQRELRLPPGAVVELWTCPVSASTPALIAAVARLAERAPAEHQRWLGQQAAGAERAVQAAEAGDAAGFIAALAAQARALSGLGRAAGVPIVTPELGGLAAAAEAEGAVLLPAGAGGGDVALFVGSAAPSASLRAALAARAHQRLEVELAAAGASASAGASAGDRVV